MTTPQHPDSSVEKLLRHLPEKQDDHVALTTLKGRALSRSANNVHLAIAGGIVAVPIANIESVVPISDSQPDAVRIVVRNPQEIQPILRVRPGGPPAGDGSTLGGHGTIEVARDGETIFSDRTFKDYVGVATCTSTDTDTISGGHGEPDACDDSVPDNCPPDDVME
jgi:hypothetical protein